MEKTGAHEANKFEKILSSSHEGFRIAMTYYHVSFPAGKFNNQSATGRFGSRWNQLAFIFFLFPIARDRERVSLLINTGETHVFFSDVV